jgi:dihydrofolate synthase / folylpolyglutamate synthase
MSYDAAIQSLYGLVAELHSKPGSTRKFRLEDMQALAAGLGNPQSQFRAVLVAGTNGKGSTSATLASILMAAGYRTGLYTSPHLIRTNERIRIQGKDIADDDFGRLYFVVEDQAKKLVKAGILPSMPSFFETMTALAFLYFAEKQVDIAVLEVGMGGRLDATNIVEPLVSVITDISLDHTEWLGNTIAEITREKAGILRPMGIMVTLPQHPEANQTLGEIAVPLEVEGVSAAEYIPGFVSGHETSYSIAVLGEEILVNSPLLGAHQQRNIALAIATAVELRNRHSYNITPQNIESGIRMTSWPGRMERVGRNLWIDVAHNPAGAWALRSAVSQLVENPSTLVFGCLADKAVDEMVQILFPIFDRVVLTEVNSPRAARMEQMVAAAELTGTTAYCTGSVKEALAKARELTPDNAGIVVCGSLYLVGDAQQALREEALLS